VPRDPVERGEHVREDVGVHLHVIDTFSCLRRSLTTWTGAGQEHEHHCVRVKDQLSHFSRAWRITC